MLYTISVEQIKINQTTPFFEDFFLYFHHNIRTGNYA